MSPGAGRFSARALATDVEHRLGSGDRIPGSSCTGGRRQEKRPGLPEEGPALDHVRGLTGSRCGTSPSTSGARAAGGLGTATRLGGTARLGAAAGAAVLATTAEQPATGATTRLGGAAGRSGTAGRLGGAAGRLGGRTTRLGSGTAGLGTAAVAAGPATTQAGGRRRVNGHEADDSDGENHRRKYGKTLHKNLLMTNLTG